MSLFKYTAVGQDGKEREGTIDAISQDVAISALQRRGLVIASIQGAEKQSVWNKNIGVFSGVRNRDVVLLSRQITTLFEAQVSALRAFRLMAAETENPALQNTLTEVANDLQSGSSISDALSKHKKVFSNFYVSMVRAGEETGRLDETFAFLADYLDRSYEITSKARNALIYPAFVIATFIGVMTLMLTTVIPRLSEILTESGQAIPIYTKIVIGFSLFLTKYFWLLLGALLIGGVMLYRYSQTEAGSLRIASAKLELPYLGGLYQKLFLSRVSDNLSTMLKSGIQMVRAVEITASVVDNATYKRILMDSAKEIQSGRPASEVFAQHRQFPGIVVAMMRVGEETGDLSNILDTMAKFYRREVSNAVDTLVSLIEPVMIVTLALGVGVLLASVLIPIYNISAGM
jgi:type IV pilus assembly protein PilC